MTQGKRFGLSAAQKRDLWRRWKAADSLHKIGRAFGKEHSRHGGRPEYRANEADSQAWESALRPKR
jgi:hypothetical protein